MSAKATPALPIERHARPADVCGMSDVARDALIISALQVNSQWVALSRYGDMVWRLTGWTSNKARHEQNLDFQRIPEPYRLVMKALVYRYMRRGRAGRPPPKPTAVKNFFISILPFIRYLERLAVSNLGQITPLLAANYVAECRAYRQRSGKPLASSTLKHRYRAVELLCELSHYTDTPVPQPPWSETSASVLARLPADGGSRGAGKTPVIPDDVFATLFQRAYELVQRGDELLDLRDELDVVESKAIGHHKNTIGRHKWRHLESRGWTGGFHAFRRALVDLRTACYILVAATSGCRNHEIAYLQRRAWSRTVDDEGIVYHWMHSKSTKTDAGRTQWMIPDVAVRALRVMDRWATSYQAIIGQEIDARRTADRRDPEIAEAEKHQHAVFLGVKRSLARTLSLSSWNTQLRKFSREYCGLNWDLATHQFRRTFAHYAARSQFGDLRYLQVHYKHWSMDMTLGYALNESQELDLYIEIQDELEALKTGVVDEWFKTEHLAGGYGRAIVDWRGKEENITLFKDRASMVQVIAGSTAIRSNG